MERLYLDYNGSTPVAPVVFEAMRPYLTDHHGNPSAGHAAGRALRRAIEEARERVATLLGAHPDEIIFTSGGTESNNTVIKGLKELGGKKENRSLALAARRRRVITSRIEHPAVTQPCRYLERHGFEVTWLDVDSDGRVDPEAARQALRSGAALITIMHANNETGVIQPIREIADVARAAGVLVHTDAAQTAGKIPTRVEELGVDFLSVAGHKLYAPHGVGALYARRGTEFEPLLHGAGHEAGRRAGTEAVAAIVGLGAAAEYVGGLLEDSSTWPITDASDTAGQPVADAPGSVRSIAGASGATGGLRRLRDRLHDGLKVRYQGRLVVQGEKAPRLPNTLNVSFVGCSGRAVLEASPEVCATTGAACHEGSERISPVLQAMRLPPEVARGALRLSVGHPTTTDEIDRAIRLLSTAANGLYSSPDRP